MIFTFFARFLRSFRSLRDGLSTLVARPDFNNHMHEMFGRDKELERTYANQAMFRLKLLLRGLVIIN